LPLIFGLLGEPLGSFIDLSISLDPRSLVPIHVRPGIDRLPPAGYILNMAIGYMDNQLRARTREARVTKRLIEADA
jgi:hypothetical protein